MSTRKIEIQDHEGNVYHPHTSADVVYMPDGTDIKTSISSLKTKVDNGQNYQLTLDNGNAYGFTNGNADDCVGMGRTYIGENITNSPNKATGSWWTIVSYRQGDYGHQIAYEWHGDGTYIRNLRANNWTSWRRL